ncbi:MAG: hypothetical protein Kow00120_09180 [Anaerolineae bacterium]
MKTGRVVVVLGLIAAAGLLAACDRFAPPPAPTSTAAPPTLVTVMPQVPTLDETSPPGVNDPDAAAAPSGGAVPLRVAFLAADGLTLHGLYYPQPEASPGVLLLHMLGRTKEDWENIAGAMQAAGFVVLAMDLRGHGDTGGEVDWSRARQDTLTMLAYLRELPNVDPARVGIVGASIGANLALNGCADDPACRAAVLLSPGLDYRGVTTEDAIAALGAKPLLLVASEDDAYAVQTVRTLDGLAQGERQLQVYQNAGHGTGMFNVELGLTDLIIGWLQTQL